MSLAAGKAYSGLTILACFGGGSLYGWSGYLPTVRAQFGVSNASASMVFSLALLSFTLGVLLGPYLFAHIPMRYRLGLLAGLSVLALSIAGASVGFAGFVLSYGLCFGFVAGALYNYAISTASASVAAPVLVPFSVAAFGLGGAVFGPAHVWLTAAGWGLWSLAPALVCLAFVAILALVMRPFPALEEDGQARPEPMIIPDKMIVTLGIIFAAGSCSGLIVLGFASQILPRGADGVGLASLAIFLAAIGNTLGRLCAAITADRFGSALAIMGALVLSMITLGALIFASVPGVVVGLLFLVAFAYGQLAATMPLLVKSMVSGAAFSRSFGWVFIGWGVAGLLGPWSAGWLMDVTGSVHISLILCILLAALSLWLVSGFIKSDRPS
ncbi:MAG: hypothetical protein ABJP79_03165 [Tateyamaria sp.]|uniref:hypothetical protein n=1 Tax=Tateyamaria sp. TaxID=1929288 RepID=UPI00329F03C2